MSESYPRSVLSKRPPYSHPWQRLLVVALLVISISLVQRLLPTHSDNALAANLQRKSLAIDCRQGLRLVPVPERCEYILEHCREPASGLGNYLKFYYCDMNHQTWGILVLTAVMIYVFAMLGTAAGEYLCPNLANISAWLHLSESVAGVTLAAVGNGAPDLFSTFSAMTADTPGLAIGELLGAALFVSLVVVGAVAILTPFKLPRRPFIRDIVAFIGALALVFAICADKKITHWEAWMLILYYFIYVLVVILGAWIYRKQKALRFQQTLSTDGAAITSDVQQPIPTSVVIDFDDTDEDRPFFETDPLLTPVEDAHDGVSGEADFDADFFLPHFKPHKLPTEFLHLPNGGKFHRSFSTPDSVRQFVQPPTTPREEVERPLIVRRNTAVPVNRSNDNRSSRNGPNMRWKLRPHSAGQDYSRDVGDAHSNLGSDNEDNDSDRDEERRNSVTGTGEANQLTGVPPTSKADFLRKIAKGVVPFLKSHSELFSRLLPVLSQWKHLTFPSKVQGIVLTPIYFVFSLTVPTVYDEEMELAARREYARQQRLLTDRDDEDGSYADSRDEISDGNYSSGTGDSNGIAGQAADNGVDSPAISSGGVKVNDHITMEDAITEVRFKPVNRKLTVVQLSCAPLFVAFALQVLNVRIGPLAVPIWVPCLIVGVMLGLGSYYLTRRTPTIKFGRLLAICGFITSVMWIYVVASEVVGILGAMATILGTSEHLMGLTLFAMGNSVGDLMTNISIARMGYPTMAVGACFGSPMLNLVLGIGVTATYITGKTGESYPLGSESLAPVLFCAGALAVGLLGSLIYIPWNGFKAHRGYGVGLWTWYAVAVSGILWFAYT
ncbi:Sodium/calcium exchanger protein-domain-containing protein [Phlyctochytrium arcticum]|nr:Sodium/calcium exchanger protein-domain-containing protein [Phlyctochytrium arcticum]